MQQLRQASKQTATTVPLQHRLLLPLALHGNTVVIHGTRKIQNANAWDFETSLNLALLRRKFWLSRQVSRPFGSLGNLSFLILFDCADLCYISFETETILRVSQTSCTSSSEP